MKKYIAIVAFVFIGWLLWGILRTHKIQKAFENVSPQSSQSMLINTLGKPWKSGECGAAFGGTMLPGCKQEVLYASPFAPAIPEYWAFFFDSQGRLVDKYTYESP